MYKLYDIWQIVKYTLIFIFLFILITALVPWEILTLIWNFIKEHFFLIIIIIGPIIVTVKAVCEKVSQDIWDKKHGENASGEKYENLVAKKINKMFDISPIRNVLIPVDETKFTETDMVLINEKGIFCIECKYHYSTYPYSDGCITDKEWVFGNDIVTNPFMQNRYHVQMLKKHLHEKGIDNIPVYSVIASSSGLENIRDEKGRIFTTLKSNDYQCYFHNAAFFQITKKSRTKYPLGFKMLPDVLTNNEVKQYTKYLKSLSGGIKERKAHASRLQWEEIKTVLPDLSISLIKNKRTGKMESPSKNKTGRQHIKNDLRKLRFKYVILYIKYLGTEEVPWYTEAAKNRMRANPYYTYTEKDIAVTHIELKDAYVIKYEILSYREAMRHPEFKKKNAVIGHLTESHPFYHSFLCFIEKTDTPPEIYDAYMPTIKSIY